MSTMPLVQPAATTPGCALNFAISAALRSGSADRGDGLFAGAHRVAGDNEAAQGNLEFLPLQAFQKIQRRVQLHLTPIDSGDTSLKSFGAGVMPSSTVWLSLNSFSLRSELSDEATSVTVGPMPIWP